MVRWFFLQFSKRIEDEYPEIYKRGSSEGSQAGAYFEKWGWYATIVSLANDDILKMKKILKKSIHEVHLFLAHRIDRQIVESNLRKK